MFVMKTLYESLSADGTDHLAIACPNSANWKCHFRKGIQPPIATWDYFLFLT